MPKEKASKPLGTTRHLNCGIFRTSLLNLGFGSFLRENFVNYPGGLWLRGGGRDAVGFGEGRSFECFGLLSRHLALEDAEAVIFEFFAIG